MPKVISNAAENSTQKGKVHREFYTETAVFLAYKDFCKTDIPAAIDGKRHQLRVELTKEAKAKHKGVRLRYRPEYIPVREEPEWAH